MFESYPQYEDLLARVQLVLMMLAMGLTLSVRDFLQVAQRPRSLVVGLLCQLALAPLLALTVNALVLGGGSAERGIAVGLILIAVMPGGGLSKVFAFLGRGNMALSIGLSAVGSLATLVMVPLSLRLF